jgi:plasmid maintenance system antidote protein VapI
MRYENTIQRNAWFVNNEFADCEEDGVVRTMHRSGGTIEGMRNVNTNELDTYGGRIGWLLRVRRRKQIDLANGLGRSPSSVSEIINNKKEFNWSDTARLVTFLKTNADFFLGLTEDDSPVAERDGKSQTAPYYQHEEADEVAKIVDESPEWLRKQMLATVRAQYDAYLEEAEDVTSEEWAERLRNAVKVSGLLVGDERTREFVSQIESIILEATHRQGRDRPKPVAMA